MRSIAILLSSLWLLAAVPQDGDPDKERKAQVKTLAGDEADRALKAFDLLPVAELERIHRLAAAESAEVRSAARRLVPPASWILSGEGTIGDVRARLAELVATLARKEALPRDELLKRQKQLLIRGGPMVVEGSFRAFQGEVHERSLAATQVLEVHGAPDLTPALLELLAKGSPPPSYVHRVIAAVGDARAALPALARLEVDSNETQFAFQVSSRVGGTETLEAMNRLKTEGKLLPLTRHEFFQARLRLRDPQLPRDVLTGGRDFMLGHDAFAALTRLADAAPVPDLVRIAKDPKAPAADRSLAVRVLAVVGAREHAPLFRDCLKDPPLWGAAAAALNEIDDPDTAAALAPAVNEMLIGEFAAEVILRLPWRDSSQLEAPALEWLAHPDRHPRYFSRLLRIAGRVGGPKIRDRLLELLTAPGNHRYDDFEVALALRPHFDFPNLRKLSRSSSPEAPREDESARAARLALRGALGDEESRAAFVAECANTRYPGAALRNRESVSALLQYPGPPEEILPLVREQVNKHPNWLAGALYLTKHKGAEGLALVRSAMEQDEKFDWAIALQDLPPSVAWDLGLERLERICDDEALAYVSPGIPDRALPSLRKQALAEASETQLARPSRQRRSKRPGMYGHAAGADSIALGFLAARTDPVMESLYRWVVRVRAHEEFPDFTYSMSAQALARLGATDMLDTYRRMSRSTASAERALGLRCLALLGDRRAMVDAAPLLNDHEAVPRTHIMGHDKVDARPLPRVCDFAADAIEKLSGQTFPSGRTERIAAIKNWVAASEKK